MNSIINEIKDFLIRTRILYQKPYIDYENKRISFKEKQANFSDIISITQNSYFKSNYALFIFLIVTTLTFLTALVYNIYLVENTFTIMNAHDLAVNNLLEKLKGLPLSDGISKTYEYDSMFLFFGPLFNGLV